MLGGFVQSNLNLQNLIPSLTAYKSLIDESKTLKERKSGDQLEKITKNIEFKSVSFTYDNGYKALNNCNLIFNKNIITAISGKSGAGKSTIIDLITGIQTPSSGKILIDNVDINNYNLNSFRNKISLVSQEPFLMSQLLIIKLK